MFRKFCIIILTVLISCALWAGFLLDPDSLLGNDTVTITGSGGSTVDVGFSPSPGFSGNNFVSGLPNVDETNKLTTIKPVTAIQSAFPFTPRVAFSGFLHEDGQPVLEKISRLTLFYYDRSGGWMILRDIVDPEYEVISADGDGKLRALFGNDAVPSPLGYDAGDYIPLLFYFESESGNYASFDLETFLSLRQYRGAPNYAPGANVLALVVKKNSKPR